MVVNSIGAVLPRAVDRSQLVQNRWNPYASAGLEPTMPLGPGYGSPYDGAPGAAYYGHPLHSHPMHSLVAAGDGSQGYGMKFTSSGDGYGGSAHGSSAGYDYHPPGPPHPPPPPPPSIIHSLPPLWPAPSHGKSGKGKGAALSALTLLAFLYFLNLLQSCLKEHMETMNPTVMVMTAGATRRKDISASLEQAGPGSAEDVPRDDGADDAIGRYEGLAQRYQLLTTSNGTRNPYGQPKRSRRPQEQAGKKQSPDGSSTTRRKRPPQHAGPGSDWYERH
uniref:Uncharacterized protein n=1 Tax=Anopheles dirus TaxID=7168 RepID=A0A182N5L7_9DIPT